MMSSSETVRWVSWPLHDEPPRKTMLLFALIGLTVALSALMSLFAGLLAALLLFVLLGPYLLPTRYEVSERGVEKRFPLFNRSRSWDVYRRYAIMKDGVFLGTFVHPSRLDSFRGDFLRFNAATDKDRVMALVEKHMGAMRPGEPSPQPSLRRRGEGDPESRVSKPAGVQEAARPRESCSLSAARERL